MTRNRADYRQTHKEETKPAAAEWPLRRGDLTTLVLVALGLSLLITIQIEPVLHQSPFF